MAITPLAFNKPHIEEIDRQDNTGVADSTSTTKRGGYAMPGQNIFSVIDEDGTIVVQAWPNSDDVRCTGRGGGEKWYLWCAEPTTYTVSWFHFCIPTADNQQVGGGGDYDLLGSNGVLKGQICVPFRIRPTGPNQDGLILIDSGSVYDWNDPQPISIALASVKSPTSPDQGYKASINGETKECRFEGRGSANPPSGSFWTDITPSGQDVTCTWGYNPRAFDESLMSGSYYEVAYYNTSLTQDEMNVLTAQPVGTPLRGILPNKEPVWNVRFREDEKETKTAPPAFVNDQISTAAFPNLGTETSVNVSQAVSVAQQAGIMTSGSVYEQYSKEYRTRL